MNPAMILPGCSDFISPSMTPRSTRSITPSEKSSVWTPRCLRSVSSRSTESGTAPIPVWSVAPSGMRPATLPAIRCASSDVPAIWIDGSA